MRWLHCCFRSRRSVGASHIEPICRPGQTANGAIGDAHLRPSRGEVEELVRLDLREGGSFPVIDQELDGPGRRARRVIPSSEGGDKDGVIQVWNLGDACMLHLAATILAFLQKRGGAR